MKIKDIMQCIIDFNFALTTASYNFSFKEMGRYEEVKERRFSAPVPSANRGK